MAPIRPHYDDHYMVAMYVDLGFSLTMPQFSYHLLYDVGELFYVSIDKHSLK